MYFNVTARNYTLPCSEHARSWNQYCRVVYTSMEWTCSKLEVILPGSKYRHKVNMQYSWSITARQYILLRSDWVAEKNIARQYILSCSIHLYKLLPGSVIYCIHSLCILLTCTSLNFIYTALKKCICSIYFRDILQMHCLFTANILFVGRGGHRWVNFTDEIRYFSIVQRLYERSFNQILSIIYNFLY